MPIFLPRRCCLPSGDHRLLIRIPSQTITSPTTKTAHQSRRRPARRLRLSPDANASRPSPPVTLRRTRTTGASFSRNLLARQPNITGNPLRRHRPAGPTAEQRPAAAHLRDTRERRGRSKRTPVQLPAPIDTRASASCATRSRGTPADRLGSAHRQSRPHLLH